MKKKYIAPAMEIEIMEMETLMAASPEMTIDPNVPGSNVVEAKGGASFSVWGDDDEE